MDDYKSLMIKSEEVSLILDALEDLLYKTAMDMNKFCRLFIKERRNLALRQEAIEEIQHRISVLL